MNFVSVHVSTLLALPHALYSYKSYLTKTSKNKSPKHTNSRFILLFRAVICRVSNWQLSSFRARARDRTRKRVYSIWRVQFVCFVPLEELVVLRDEMSKVKIEMYVNFRKWVPHACKMDGISCNCSSFEQKCFAYFSHYLICFPFLLFCFVSFFWLHRQTAELVTSQNKWQLSLIWKKNKNKKIHWYKNKPFI